MAEFDDAEAPALESLHAAPKTTTHDKAAPSHTRLIPEMSIEAWFVRPRHFGLF